MRFPITSAPWFTRLITRYINCQIPWLKNFNIRCYIRYFNIDLSQSVISDYREFPSFNSFFTRKLKPELRPIERKPKVIISPVDGSISEIGNIEQQQILQAKNHHYTLDELLADPKLASLFSDGQFATLYLSPSDYHRVHMPYPGTLTKMNYVPGKLFSVKPKVVSKVPKLFARNERVVCMFDTDLGPMAVIFVGATLVASINTVWEGLVTPNDHLALYQWKYLNGPRFEVGDEIGHFQLGSTIILLFPSHTMVWEPHLNTDTALRMGQMLGKKIR